jgi:hypothetical protein
MKRAEQNGGGVYLSGSISKSSKEGRMVIDTSTTTMHSSNDRRTHLSFDRGVVLILFRFKADKEDVKASDRSSNSAKTRRRITLVVLKMLSKKPRGLLQTGQ